MQTAFEVTKQKLANVNTLAIIQPEGQLILETDASGIGIGAVLLQNQKGTERPIAYYSKALNTAERNYDVCKREMFALVKAVKYFSLYLAGNSFTVRTDNSALRWWRNMEVSPGSTVARWKTILDSYNFEIAHLPGKNNAIADALSRKPESVPNTPIKPKAVEKVNTTKPVVKQIFVNSKYKRAEEAPQSNVVTTRKQTKASSSKEH